MVLANDMKGSDKNGANGGVTQKSHQKKRSELEIPPGFDQHMVVSYLAVLAKRLKLFGMTNI